MVLSRPKTSIVSRCFFSKQTTPLDLIWAAGEDSASATAEILGMKKEKEEALDLIRVGKKERAEAATTETIRTKKKEVLDLLLARKRVYDESKPTGTPADTEEKNVKRKKVVKRMFSQAFIDFLMSKKPRDVAVPDDVLAKYPKRTRDIYDISVAIANKSLEYEKAVLDQYMELGYAVDEKEVTDDEMEN